MSRAARRAVAAAVAVAALLLVRPPARAQGPEQARPAAAAPADTAAARAPAHSASARVTADSASAGAPGDSTAARVTGTAPAAPTIAAPSDSLLDRYLGGLADSTDRYFGAIAAPPDTAGLDSALVAGLSHPWRGTRTRTRPSYGPVYAFNRVDGTLWGAALGLGNYGAGWAVRGDLGYTGGSHTWLGGGRVTLHARGDGVYRQLRIDAGRRTASMDRDHEERWVASLRALARGSDRQDYLRRDGVSIAALISAQRWGGELAYHDWLESPLTVTTRWDLARRPLGAPDNLAAAFGRTREAALDGKVLWPWLPFSSQGTLVVSDGALGSDFDYRRARLAIGGEQALGGHVSLLPQLVYGRLFGDAVPQAAFYLGGPATLRSLPAEARGGTGMALARLDVVGADDLLELAHLPHPALLALQGGVFAATGAVWGADPRGGPGTPAGGWPRRRAWRSEVGGSLLYRPGLPSPDAYFRLDYAHPLGAHGDAARWSFGYARALDLLRLF